MAAVHNEQNVESIDSDELPDMFCESCHMDGSHNVPAVGFCVDCVTYYCETCLKFHTKFLPDHFHQDYDNMPKDFCFEKCVLHSNEVVKFYCQNCEVFVCDSCRINNHKKCDDVQHIPSLISQFDENGELEHFEEKIQHVEKRLADTKETIRQRYEEIRQCEERVESVIEEHRNDVNRLFDELEAEVKTEIDEVTAGDRSNLASNSEKLLKLETKFESIKSESVCTKRPSSRCKILMMVRRMKNGIESTDESLKNLSNETQIHAFTYVPSGIMKGSAELGTLKINTKRKNPESECTSKVSKQAKSKVLRFMSGLKLVSAVVIPVLAIIVSIPFLVRTKAGIKTEADEPIFVHEQTDESDAPYLIDLCHFHEHFLIATDLEHGLLLLISTTEKRVVSHFSFWEYSSCATIGENSFAMVSADEIWLMRIDNLDNIEAISWSKTRTIYLASDAIDIHYRNEKLYVFFYRKIKIIDVTGNVILKEIALRQYYSSDSSILSYNETVILLSNYDENTVTILDIASDDYVETVYKHKVLVGPGGMTVDNKGNVYVCGAKSNTIHVLYSNLSTGKVLLNKTDGIKSPWAIAFSDTENKLFVASHAHNEIAVFKIK